MKHLQNILIGAALDDRDPSTIRHAARFAQLADSKAVCLAHVAPTFDLPADAPEKLVPVDEDIEQKLRAAIQEQIGLFPAGINVHVAVRQGGLVAEMLRLASQTSADLLCLGRPAGNHDALSDAAAGLVRKAPCSVLVVPATGEPNYERILVPVDFSAHAREALELACAVAQSTPGATVTALHVYDVPQGWHKGPYSYEECAATMMGHAERQWAAFAAAANTRGVPLAARFELGDAAATTIQNVADAIDASLIVLASHGRTRPAAFLLGHVADTVCAQTTRPTFCVKRKGEVVSLLHALLQLFELEDE